MQTTNYDTLNTFTCHELSDNRTDHPGSECGDTLPPHVPEVLPSPTFPSASCRAWNGLGRQSLSLLICFRVIQTNAEAGEALGRWDTPSGTCFPVFLHICFQARCGQLMLAGRVPATRCPDTRRSLCASVGKPPATLTCKETRYFPSGNADKHENPPRASLPTRLPPYEAKNGRERFPTDIITFKNLFYDKRSNLSPS